MTQSLGGEGLGELAGVGGAEQLVQPEAPSLVLPECVLPCDTGSCFASACGLLLGNFGKQVCIACATGLQVAIGSSRYLVCRVIKLGYMELTPSPWPG